MDEYQKRHMEKCKKLDAELDKLLAANGKAALDKRFLKDFQCINAFTFDDAAQHEFDLAKRYHDREMEAAPAKHNCRTKETFRCYDETSCTCGFKYAVDSSD